MQKIDSFESQEQDIMQKIELELYVDEPRVSSNTKFEILDFWKGNQFRYPEMQFGILRRYCQ